MTKGCTIEAHNFQRDQDQYAKRNTVVLGVSVDSVDSHKEFCTKEGLNFKLLADTDHKVVSEYGSLMNLGIADCLTPHLPYRSAGEDVRLYGRGPERAQPGSAGGAERADQAYFRIEIANRFRLIGPGTSP